MKSKNLSFNSLLTKQIFSENICQNNQNQPNSLTQQIINLKKPYLNRIQYSKFKVESLITKTSKNTNQTNQLIQQNDQNLVKKPKQIKINCFVLQQKNRNNKQKQSQSSFEEQICQEKQNKQQIDLPLKEWPGRNKDRIFKNSTNIIEEYDKVFKQKITGSGKKTHMCSYKKAENQMLLKIYHKIKDLDEQTVSLKNVAKFLKSHQIFLKVYGIKSNEVDDVLSFSAHKYQKKLTKQQFLRLFFVDYSNQKDNQNQYKEITQKRCCLDEQNWTQLKKIFYQLDTFGYGYVKSEQFLMKMSKSCYKQLLQSNAIYFPTIKRYYSFKKIIFQLQHKDNLKQEITWDEIEQKIINFQHINNPTIDLISLQHIKNACIIENSQSFMLKEEVIEALKKQFRQCPKFCNNFVKRKYFCTQLITSEEIKSFFQEYVRTDNSKTQKVLVTLESNIKLLKKYGPEFLDLDEMLYYFSVKGFEKELRMKNFQDLDHDKQTDEQFEEKKKQKQKLRRMKSIQLMQKVMRNSEQFSHYKNQKTKQKKLTLKRTYFQEFNITKKRDNQTIRQKKVQEIIQQKQQKQKSQIKSYVKANPIPASINGQKYLKQVQKFQTKKLQQKTERQLKKSQDDRRIRYLMRNTKLFTKNHHQLDQDKNKNFILSSTQHNNFEAKPIQWYVKQRNLLQLIQSQKQQKRRNRLKETREKYLEGYWKKLPYDESNIKKQNQKYKEDDSIEKELKEIKKMFDQKENVKIKANPVPDFVKLQSQFLQQLQSKKRMKSLTVVKEFNLTSPKQKAVRQEHNVTHQIVSPPKTINYHNQRQLIIGTTKKFESMVKKNHKKMIQQKYEEFLKELEGQERVQKQKVFAKFMKNALKVVKKNTLKTKKKCRKQVHGLLNSKKIHEKQLNKMYQRVLSRPFLFQNYQSQKNLLKSSKNTKISKHHPKINEKFIPKIIIPRQTDNDELLNPVQQLQWQDKQTERNINDLTQQQQEEDYQVEQGGDEDEDDQNQEQQEYENEEGEQDDQTQTVRNFHNQSF